MKRAMTGPALRSPQRRKRGLATLLTAGALLTLLGLVGYGVSFLHGPTPPAAMSGTAAARHGQAALHNQAALREVATKPYVTDAVPNALQAAVNAGTHVQAGRIAMHRITRSEGLSNAKKVLDKGAQTAGCTVGYGRNGACLPLVSPAGQAMGGMTMRWTCAEVRSLFPHGIALTTRGVDPQHLDANNDGTACGAGD